MAEPGELFVIRGDMLERWTTAQQKLIACSNSRNLDKKSRAELLKDPAAWSKSFQAKRHQDASKFDAACNKVRKSLGIIQKVLQTVGFAIDVASSAVPAVKPAAFVINAFSWLFDSFTKVSTTFDAIETLFERLSWRFKVIASAEVKSFGEQDVLQECVVNMFVCCLEFCEKAFEKVESKPKLWFELLGGRDEAGAAMRKLEDAHQALCDCISWKTLTGVGELLEKVSNDERNEILRWMSKMDHRKMHWHVKSQVPQIDGVGQWLLESKLFRSWKDQQGVNRIWYTGNPGAGKSVLSSVIIDHLHEWAEDQSSHGKHTRLAYLYMSYTSPSDLNTLLGSILRQCHRKYDDFLPEIYKRFLDYRSNPDFEEPLSTKDIKLMLSQVSMNKEIFVVIDALDECPLSFRKDLIRAIEGIHPDIKILITSRVLQQLETFQKDYQTDKIVAHDDDMDKYIEHAIGKSPTLGSMSTYHDKIKARVKQKSERMFIIVRLHMEALTYVATEPDLEDALETLPETIHDTYESALRRIRSSLQGRDLATSTLAWVAYARRILSMKELQHALAIEKRTECTGKDLQPENEILSHCCGLIIKDVDYGVRFVHRSASEFFDRTRDSEFPDFNERMTIACARYLSMPSLQQHLATESSDSLGSISLDESSFPFIRYAGEFLHEHHRRVRDFQKAEGGLAPIQKLIWDDDTRAVYSQLLLRYTSYSRSSAMLIDKNYHTLDQEHREEPLQPLHIAVYLGSLDLVNQLIREGVDLNTVDPYGQSALTIAISCGLDTIATAILSGGAKVDLSTKRGHMILLYAMERDNKHVVAGIIEEPTVYTLDEGFLKILGLILLVLFATLERVKVLMAGALFQTKVSTPPTFEPSLNDERTAPGPALEKYKMLLRSAYTEDLDGLEMLLDTKGSDPIDFPHECQAHPGDDVVSEARSTWREMLHRHGSSSSDENVNMDTLEDQVSMETDDSEYPTTTQDSSSRGTGTDREIDEDATSSSQERCDDFEEIKGAFVTSACFLAVENGKWRSVEILLQYGVSPNLKDFEGRTLLHRATARDDYRLVKLLIDHKAEIDLRDSNGRTALMANATVKKFRVLQLLRKHGADLNLTQREGCHEIYEAAVFGAAEVVEFYLKYKVNPSITNNFGWTPLHGAAANGHLECVELLLKHDANATPVSDTGETPLDFVELEQSHYDHILTGRKHYAKQIEQAKALSAQDRATRMDEIHDRLVGAKAMRAGELKRKIGMNEFYRRMSHPSWQRNSWWDQRGRTYLRYQYEELN